MKQGRSLAEFIVSHPRTGRVMASFIPAAALTLGLFWTMNQLIEVKEVSLKQSTFRQLAQVALPEEKPLEIREKGFDELERIKFAPLPDNREIAKIEPGDLVFKVPDFSVPDSNIPQGVMEPIKTAIAPHLVRETAIPVRQPIPDYPERALENGLEGQCEVTFSIDAAGRPFGLSASCTDKVFARSSVQAVEKALFAAKIKNGVPVGQTNLVYPIHFELNE